jgi:hypothetical protein
MLKSYFEIIRFAISQNRQKQDGIYYEAHHIVPNSFNKKSSTVLLTPEEHYRVHMYLAEAFKHHSKYSQKVYWSFHRLAYDGKREITEQEYAQARKLLMPLWKTKKSEDHRKKIGEAHKGKKWVLNPISQEYRQISQEDLQGYLDSGWQNTHKFKDNWAPTEETRQAYSQIATKRQLGKVGDQSRASKGSVICENIETGEKIEAGSALQLAKKLGDVHFSVIHEALNGSQYDKYKPRSKGSKYYNFLQTHKIYYK